MAEEKNKILSKKALKSNIRSVFMLAVFVVFWAAFMSIGFGLNTLTVIAFVIFLIYSVWLCIMAIKTRRAIQSLPDSFSDEATLRAEKRTGRCFGIIFGVETVLIMAAATLFGNGIIGNPNYISPVVALIVGTHLFPLSALFHGRRNLITGGIIMDIFAIAAIILIANGLIINIAIGVCCLVAALCIATGAANLLYVIRKSLKVAVANNAQKI